MRTVPPGIKAAAAPAVLAALGAVLLLAGLAALPACRSFSAAGKLAPAHAEFLAKVDYIITKEERKIFLELPESGRD
ncbi:MAG: hypothetical protein EHM31_08230, partial [Candidatus Aminicenantes bacterium]